MLWLTLGTYAGSAGFQPARLPQVDDVDLQPHRLAQIHRQRPEVDPWCLDREVDVGDRTRNATGTGAEEHRRSYVLTILRGATERFDQSGLVFSFASHQRTLAQVLPRQGQGKTARRHPGTGRYYLRVEGGDATAGAYELTVTARPW